MFFSFIPQTYAQGTPVDIGPVDCVGAFCNLVGAEWAHEIEKLVSTLVGFLTVVAGLSFFIYFVVGAVTWITSGGDSGNVDKAKKMMTNALIGMIAVVAAYAITWIVSKVLGIDILNPYQTILYNIGSGAGGLGGFPPNANPTPP